MSVRVEHFRCPSFIPTKSLQPRCKTACRLINNNLGAGFSCVDPSVGTMVCEQEVCESHSVVLVLIYHRSKSES